MTGPPAETRDPFALRYEGDPCPVCGARLIVEGGVWLVCSKFLHFTATVPRALSNMERPS